MTMSLCIYSGGDTGFEEKRRFSNTKKRLPGREYTVIVHEYFITVSELSADAGIYI